MLKWLLGIFIVVLAAVGIASFFVYREYQEIKTIDYYPINVGDAELNVETALTTEEWVKGLGYRDSLPYDHGMLFIGNTLQLPSFWMQGMEFPLDIIWIRDNEIIDIDENAQIPVEGIVQESYRPSVAVDKVLEVNAGWVEDHDIKVGDSIKNLEQIKTERTVFQNLIILGEKFVQGLLKDSDSTGN